MEQMISKKELWHFWKRDKHIFRVIEKHIDFVQIIIEDTNYKDQLLRKFQAMYHMPPRYKEITVVGPPHDRIFTMGVLDPSDRIIATATARNKKVAEQEASRSALEKLESSFATTTATDSRSSSPSPSPTLVAPPTSSASPASASPTSSASPASAFYRPMISFPLRALPSFPTFPAPPSR